MFALYFLILAALLFVVFFCGQIMGASRTKMEYEQQLEQSAQRVNELAAADAENKQQLADLKYQLQETKKSLSYAEHRLSEQTTNDHDSTGQ